jgi:transposase
MDTEPTAITERFRRIEVFTGAGRRRTWSAEAKARIVAETLKEGETVCSQADGEMA